MDEPLIVRADFPDYAGLITAASPHVIGTGFVDTMNVSTEFPGQVEARNGIRRVSYSGAGSADANDVLALYTLNGPDYDYHIYLDSAGQVKYGRTPS